MISIDYQSKLPLYEQVARRFQTLILKGVLEPDAQMPSVRALAVELSINPNTIQKAYAMLEQQGYIYPVKGRGNFVTDNQDVLQQKRQEFFENLRDLIKKGKDMGISKKECISYMEENWKEGLDL